jgi:AcrR family transcriptional regulator
MSPAPFSGGAGSAKSARRAAILKVAEQLARQGGADAVNMREVAQRAHIALATLYRYFPSKTDLMLALYFSRNERLMARVMSREVPGDTMGERVAHVLLTEFRSTQRNHALAEAMMAGINAGDRSVSETLSRVRRLREQIMSHAATRGARELTRDEFLALRTVLATWAMEATDWMKGVRSSDEVVEQLTAACRFLDLVGERDIESSDGRAQPPAKSR